MKKAIIFDVDGTLWDSTARIAESYNETINKMGIDGKIVTQDLVKSFMGYQKEDIAMAVFPEFTFEKRIELIDQCMEEECHYLSTHPGRLYEGVEDVLDYLYKEYELFIVSNCQDGYIETLFGAYNIQKYIKDYECSGRTGMKKSKNISLIMERNHLESAIYVGDTKKDKEASQEAHVPFIYASYGFGNVEEFDQKIDTIKGMIGLF